MDGDDNTREKKDDFGKFWEVKTKRGWQKIRREVEGIQFRIYGAKTVDYMMAMRAGGFYFRLNVMSDRIELNDAPITDIQESIIFNLLQDFGMTNTTRMRAAIHEAAARNKYHPVKEWLDTLPAWDGQQHFNAFMSKLVMSSPVTAYNLSETFWRKWMIGAISKALTGAQNYMLVLVSSQGKGKSRLVRWLCPSSKLFYEGAIAPDNNDDKIRSLNNWIWEVAELDATTRHSDVSALKSFITRQEQKVRVPYGRYDIEKQVVASYIGTVNPSGTGFLQDTENRRFAIVHLDDIDWNYEKDIDLKQLWAEIYQAFKDGESHELTRHEREIQNEINAEHITETPLEGLLLDHYILDPDDKQAIMTASELLEQLETLGLRGDQFRNRMELGKVLMRQGVIRKKISRDGRRQYAYEGIKYKDKHAHFNV